MAHPPDYAELHCLSNFSFLTGASHPEELVLAAHRQGYRALAITDQCSLAGVVRAHEAARECGLHLVVGSELTLDDGERLVLLARDRDGYGRLSALITRARRRAGKGAYRVARADLAEGLPGCLALLPTALRPGDGLRTRPGADFARFVAARFAGDAWIAVERHLGPDDAARLQAAAALGCAAGLPLLAAGDVHMHTRGRRALQDTLTAIRLKRPLAEAADALFANGERHLRARERLARLHPRALLAATLEAASRCTFSLAELRYEYPRELVPEGLTPAEHLRRLTVAGAARRFPEGVPDRVRALIEHELALVAELGYEPFFLTVHDVVRFARARGILCQGRGSAANSAVCFCLGITEVDPARMSMLFERFVSKERNEPPDIDVDFEHQRREEVIQYVYAKYGRHRAALAATVIGYRPRSAVRDLGKALGFAAAQVDVMARSLAWWDGRKVLPERVREVGLDPDTPAMRRLGGLMEQILGFPRHLSQHVGGFVIARDSIETLVPVENAAMADRTVIQWDKDDLEALGLLKVDVLALGMLSAIRRAFELVHGYRGRRWTLASVPAEDPAVYEMIQRADTVGVFQIESRAQMAMLPRMRPECFYDLVIEVAIVRPGPIQGGMVHPYLRRRQGLEPVSYPSEAVRGVLGRTLGVPIFQEQAMQLAVVAAGFTPGESDRLRRAMAAFRRRGSLGPFRERLVAGMRARGYDERFAEQVFRQIEGFGEYGFPESHSASFALLVYVSAWLKRHQPAAFCAALLNSQPMGFYAPAQLVRDARDHGVEVRAVDVLASEVECTLERGRGGEPALRLGLCMVRGLAQETARRIVDARAGRASGVGARPDPSPDIDARAGRSRDVDTHAARPRDAGARAGSSSGVDARQDRSRDFGARADRSRKVEARAGHPRDAAARPHDVDALARAAALTPADLRRLDRAGALAALIGHRHRARWASLGTDTTDDLLAGAAPAEATPMLRPPAEGEDVVADYETLGLTLGRHPLALLRESLEARGLADARTVAGAAHGDGLRAAGLVINRQRPATASGVMFLTLEDETGVINLVLWPSVVEHQRRVALGARLLGVEGHVEREGIVVHLVAKRLTDLTPLLGRLETRSRDFR